MRAEEVDAQQLFEARRQERHEGQRGVDRGVRNPAMERHRAGLGDRADHQQDERQTARPIVSSGRWICDIVSVPGLVHPVMRDADHHAQVGDADDDERLGGRLERALPADGDHAEQRQQQAFPEEQQQRSGCRPAPRR